MVGSSAERIRIDGPALLTYSPKGTMALNANRRDENSTGGVTLVAIPQSNQHRGCVFVENTGSAADFADERCFRGRRRFVGLAAALWLAFSGPAAAQQARQFPATARFGTLEVSAFPSARLDGNPVLLAPGALIRDERNALLLPQQFTGARPVLYRLDFLGQIREVWTLDERETARARAGELTNDGKTAQ